MVGTDRAMTLMYVIRCIYTYLYVVFYTYG